MVVRLKMLEINNGMKSRSALEIILTPFLFGRKEEQYLLNRVVSDLLLQWLEICRLNIFILENADLMKLKHSRGMYWCPSPSFICLPIVLVPKLLGISDSFLGCHLAVSLPTLQAIQNAEQLGRSLILAWSWLGRSLISPATENGMS